ncbi:MAG: methyl-accepting chemotaxis protein [Candidatus Binatia bacterium]
MSWLNRISIRAKFALLAIILLFALGTVGFTSYQGLQRLSDYAEQSRRYLNATQSIAEINTIQNKLHSSVSRVLSSNGLPEEASPSEILQALREDTATLTARVSDLAASVSQTTRQDSFSTLQLLVTGYVAEATELVPKALNGQKAEALQVFPDLERRQTQLANGIAILQTMIGSEAAQMETLGAEASSRTTQTALVVFLVTVFFSVLAVLLISQSITIPMAQMTAVATKLARGEIDQDVHHESRDEIGTLATAFRELIVYIREVAVAADVIRRGYLDIHLQARSDGDVLARSFLQMVDNLNYMNKQIREGADTLAVSIAQILTSMRQLTVSTSETAAAVTQTATTVEEVKQTAYVSNQKAQEIAEKGKLTSQVSEAGGRSVDEAITGMTQVREQMTGIAQSVVTLGEYTQEISNIIATVNTLAEQSNILAINAEIEAAKAGEAGRGFAIVAQEVRHLAEQSKLSTVKIHTILNDIRRAAQSAIEVTEQGTHAADIGVQRSLQAGESIRVLTKNVTETVQTVTQIAASSQQQLLGMDQVSTAMTSIRAASQENLIGIQQVDKAARDLQRVSEALKLLIEQFTLTLADQEDAAEFRSLPLAA